jgi:hypothetical protein
LGAFGGIWGHSWGHVSGYTWRSAANSVKGAAHIALTDAKLRAAKGAAKSYRITDGAGLYCAR